jgi:hypothetical protein
VSIGKREEAGLRSVGMVELPLGLGWVAPKHVLAALLDALEASVLEHRGKGRSARTMALRRAIYMAAPLPSIVAPVESEPAPADETPRGPGCGCPTHADVWVNPNHCPYRAPSPATETAGPKEDDRG